MNNLKNTSITSMEVAQMVKKKHNELLKDVRRYVGQLGEGKIPHTDFFEESAYVTEQNKKLPCFMVTKKGCEFIAHKLTGQKGTEFTARYINKFHDLEDQVNRKIEHYEPKATSLGEIASYIKVESKILERNGAAPWEVAEMSVQISRQFGLDVSISFIKRPAFEQIGFFGGALEVTPCIK